MTLSELLRATSRTFALGIELLGSPLRDEVRVAYLILRVSDYLEDNTVMAPGKKVELLSLWHRILHKEESVQTLLAALGEDEDPIPDLEAIRHVEEIMRGFEALSSGAQAVIAQHAGDSTLGMARWAERGSDFRDEADLDDYMHEVAGRVGYLLTDLFALQVPEVRDRHEELMKLGQEFGLALQTVNVIRGLGSDRDRGWVFVPRTFIPAGGPAPERLFDEEQRPHALHVLERLVAKADGHFGAALDYTTMLPRREWRIRLFCLLPLFFGVRTLALSRGNPEVLDGEVKISRPEVKAIARWSGMFHRSNRWIRWYAERLARA